jgi:hypothetical protein
LVLAVVPLSLSSLMAAELDAKVRRSLFDIHLEKTDDIHRRHTLEI